LASWENACQEKSINDERQVLANKVLFLAGLYSVTAEALAVKEGSRKALQPKEAEDDAERQLLNLSIFYEYQLREYLTVYAGHLPENRASSLMSLIVIKLNDAEAGRVLGTRGKTDSVMASSMEEIEQPLADLFDPVAKAAIAKLFDRAPASEWKKFFKRSGRNGLAAARREDGNWNYYNPFIVGEWLISKGIYTQEHVYRKLANNLPPRSKSMRFIFIGELE
jgi:hypothetical protein